VGDLTISPDGINGYHFNWEDVDPEALSAYLKDKKLYVANGKFDGRFLRRYGVKNFVIAFDTRIVGHFLNERRSNSLKTHAWLYTIHGGYDEPLEQYKRENPKVKSYLQIPKSLRIPYATMDTIVDFQVAKAMQRELLADKDYQFQNGVQGPNLHDYHEKYVVPAINLFLDLEFKGLPIDWDKVKSVGELMDKEIAKSLESVQKAFGRTDIQYKGHELAKFIEYDLKWEEIARSEPTNRVHFDEATQKWVPVFKGWYLTNKNSFSEWERLGHPEAKLLGNLASWTAMKNTFIGDESEDEEDQLEKYREKIDEMGFFNASETDTKVEKVTKDSGLWKYRGTDDRIHATFMSFLALSHRHRTQGPNLQNIPKKDRDAAKLIRQVYKTANDDEFYDAEIDYMGFQLRIACAQSDEPNMRKAFAEIPGGDLHSVTAQMIFSPKETIFEFLSKKKEKKYKNWRDKSKTTNFALLFGTSARTFMENVLIKEWTLDDALEFVRDNNLSERVLILMSKGETKRKANFLACAEKIRKIFFEDLYPGLADWHETCKNIGRTQFYIRSPFGARRLLPELEYPDGRDQDGSVIKNMENIAINSPVQNHEVIPMTWCMVKLDDFIKKHNLKSEVVLTVHDSIRIFIHRSELKVISKFILDCMAYDWPEHKDVPVCGELNLAKPWEKEIWGFGKQEITLGNVEKVCDIMEELAPQVDIPFDIAA
jgi:DNA polymerase I-like protein with 3'-5' exonuclease and polymerase domains